LSPPLPPQSYRPSVHIFSILYVAGLFSEFLNQQHIAVLSVIVSSGPAVLPDELCMPVLY